MRIQSEEVTMDDVDHPWTQSTHHDGSTKTTMTTIQRFKMKSKIHHVNERGRLASDDDDDDVNGEQRLIRTGPRVDSFDVEALEVPGAHKTDYDLMLRQIELHLNTRKLDDDNLARKSIHTNTLEVESSDTIDNVKAKIQGGDKGESYWVAGKLMKLSHVQDLSNVVPSPLNKRGIFLLAVGSPFGVLSPSHFFNSGLRVMQLWQHHGL
ncbi:hypothetical protein ACFE04_002396 [Oxalis oulophora]